MRRILFTALAATAMIVVGAGPAEAARTEQPPAGCWGELSRGLARSGGMGEHASAFAGERRAGLANVVPGGMSALCDFLG